MKCENCGSEDMEQKDKRTYICKKCWHVQRTTPSAAYTYPLDEPMGKYTKRKRI